MGNPTTNMVMPSGCENLDKMLKGGFPSRSSILISGGPGVGKSTFGMQYLQCGLDNDEACLYISTEQTKDEIKTAFRDFDFGIEHPKLQFTSIHARSKDSSGSDEREFVLSTIEGEEKIGPGYSVPFENEFIMEALKEHIPVDRVVFDSVSGLAVLDENTFYVRRAVLDLIRMFSDEFEATTLFTAEQIGSNTDGVNAPNEVLEFATHGVIELWRERVKGKERRFLKIKKMRGVDHDTRTHEYGINKNGLFLTPGNWTHQFEFEEQKFTPTNIDGLDEICGGGLMKGKPVLLEHDGRAPVDALVTSMASGAFNAGMGVWLVPSPVLNADRFEGLLPDPDLNVEELLDANKLFVLDVFNSWDKYGDHPSVYQISTTGLLTRVIKKSNLGFRSAKRVLKDIDDRRDIPVLAPNYTEAFLHMFQDPMKIRDLYYWALENVTVENDTAFYIHNPKTMDPKLAEFFSYDAAQVLETWKQDTGIQYLLLDKSPRGSPGTMLVVEYNDQPPYVSVTKTMN